MCSSKRDGERWADDMNGCWWSMGREGVATRGETGLDGEAAGACACDWTDSFESSLSSLTTRAITFSTGTLVLPSGRSILPSIPGLSAFTSTVAISDV